jgi:RNA polymerase sigma-54 factor
MTQALQQSIKLLQYNSIELREFVEGELEKNPLLQEGEAEGDAPIDAEAAPVESDEPREADFGEDQAFDSSSFDQTGDVETDYIRNDDGLRTRSATPDGDEDTRDVEDNASQDVSLRDHLLNQLSLGTLSAPEQMIGAHLIDLIDEAGYITSDFTTLSEQLGVDVAEIEQVLSHLQTFDPSGIAARNLSECLAIQLREKDRLDPAMECLLAHLNLLGEGRFDELKKKCNVDGDDLKEMIAEIKTLNPKPGLRFSFEVVQHMEPDVFVKRLPDGNWHVELNMHNFPRVMVNKRYYNKVTQETRNVQDKKYLTEQLMTANWLVRALEQRADTMLKVSSELVKQQDAFFRLGVRYLKPMILKDIAAATDYHESTISRVTSGKYLHCPRGTFELKYFFTSALQRSEGGGDDVSSMAVKNYIAEFIEKETPKHILSDDEIVALLKDRNINVARRTVAKYREALNIPASPKRKRLKNSTL